MNRWIYCRPSASEVAKANLERKVYQNSQGKVLLAETLVQQLQVCDRVIRLEPNFSDEMNNDDGLDVF